MKDCRGRMKRLMLTTSLGISGVLEISQDSVRCHYNQSFSGFLSLLKGSLCQKKSPLLLTTYLFPVTSRELTQENVR
ncbi:UNVERIFIED_CONTAM: hypothetical protein PYX00_003424 [Menopon gallinae]|uniref:Uncharacterized protein n=1 Tax=Menopon gallinae TaxID=328185 RepID=A0AAW2I125_9NEOP